MPRYIDHVSVDPAGTVSPGELPVGLPYGLAPRDFFRMVEDVHDLLHHLNTMLHAQQYPRLEELLDPAAFSGLISRTVATRLAQASRGLVVNRFHNGYPDLLVRGQYPLDSIQHGEGGLEVKASRSETSWQSHGPRAGWFVVVQFELDDRLDIAQFDLEPTKVRAVLVAELATDDWSWQPAQEGKIRSGTASIRVSGRSKLREGAVWVDPEYRLRHDMLALDARSVVFTERLEQLVVQEMNQRGVPVTAEELADSLAPVHRIDVELAQRRLVSALRKLTATGSIRRVRPGVFAAIP